MPNWVECDLTVSGNEKVLKSFEDFAKTEKSALDANKFIPYPKEFADKDAEAEEVRKRIKAGEKLSVPEDGFNSGGYEWRIKNWGTKWGICDAEISCKKLKHTFYFFTCAWNPPLPLIRKMAEMFPALAFSLRYYEAGMGFSGLYGVKGEDVLDDYMNNSYRGNRGG